MSNPRNSFYPPSFQNSPSHGHSSQSKPNVQFLLHHSPVLALLVNEIAWEKLQQLMLVRNYQMGQKVYAVGDIPNEIGFVLCGQFLIQLQTSNSDTGKKTQDQRPGTAARIEEIVSHENSSELHRIRDLNPGKIISFYF